MQIDGVSNYLYASQRQLAPGGHRSSAMSPPITLNRIQPENTTQADFASMTRLEMRSWANAQIRSGELSLDDSRPFMAMTMKVPVANGLGREPALESDGTRYDFPQIVRDGIQGALSRNDDATLKMLDSALSIMQREQDRTIGVDTRV